MLQVFKCIDELNLFQQDNGLYPCVLLDGHNSRLYEPFIKYINSPTTKWGFILGIPYGTSYWQVADTKYLNGWFKCLWYREKKKLATFKAIRGLPINMGVTDIVPCLRPALDGSFGVMENVKKALSTCGWNPLNRGALVHPDMVTRQRDDHGSTAVLDVMDVQQQMESNNNLLNTINTTSGKAGILADQFMQYQLQNQGRERRIERLEEGTQIQEWKTKSKNLTAGLLVANGCFDLNEKVVELIVERAEVRQAVVEEQASRKRKQTNNNLEKVMEARAKKGDNFNAWNVAQLKAYFQLKKNDQDGAAPNTKEALVTKCLAMAGRATPQYEHDDNDDNDDNSSNNDDDNDDENDAKDNEDDTDDIEQI